MTTGTVCKASAIILFFLDFIGAIYLGGELGGRDFGFLPFFYCLLIGFILCLFIYAMGELIDKATEIAENTRPKSEPLNNSNESQRTTDRTSIEVDTPSDNHSYVCGKCGNPEPYDGDCPKCGSSIRSYL